MSQIRTSKWSINLGERSQPLGVGKVKLKIKMKCHVLPIKMTKMYKHQVVAGVPGSRHLIHCQWDCDLVQPFGKAIFEYLLKLKYYISYDWAIPFYGSVLLFLKEGREETFWLTVKEEQSNPLCVPELQSAVQLWVCFPKGMNQLQKNENVWHMFESKNRFLLKLSFSFFLTFVKSIFFVFPFLPPLVLSYFLFSL